MVPRWTRVPRISGRCRAYSSSSDDGPRPLAACFTVLDSEVSDPPNQGLLDAFCALSDAVTEVTESSDVFIHSECLLGSESSSNFRPSIVDTPLLAQF